MAQAKCSEIIVQTLKNCKVKYIFGTPGTTEMPILSSLIKKAPSIKYITTYLDGLAIGMADGYARSSGKVGIANLHATQGTLAAVGFIRAALRDQSPVVIISGLPSHSYELVEPTHFIYGLTDILRRVTKWAWQVNSPDQTAHALERAIKIALTPPYGPTFLGIPQDLLVESSEFNSYPLHKCNNLNTCADSDKIQIVATTLLKSKNPIIFAGQKIPRSKAQKELTVLAEILAIPVISEAPDRGPQVYGVNMPSDHPLNAGYYTNRDETIKSFIDNADTIIEIGCKATYKRVVDEIKPKHRIIEITDDPMQCGNYHPITLGLTGDIKINLDKLNSILRQQVKKYTKEIEKRREAITNRINSKKIEYKKELDKIKLTGSKTTPMQLVKAMNEAFTDNTIFVDESQTFSWYFKQHFKFTLKNIVYGTGASHLGWGPPFAAGASVFHKNNKVVCLVSDASFLLSVQTLMTIAKYKLPVLIFITNNKGFTSLKIEAQSYGNFGNSQLKHLNLDINKLSYEKIANGMGIKSLTIDKPKDLTSIIKKAYNIRGPVLIDIQMDDSNNVWKDGWFKAPAK